MENARLRVVLACLAASGCMASFSESPPLPSYAGPPAALPVRLHSRSESFWQLRPGEWTPAWFAESLGDDAADAIRRSGWVSEASGSDGVVELVVRVVTYQGPGPGLLSLLTAYMIPGIMDHQIDVRVTLFRPGYPGLQCDRSTMTRTWYQTFLLFVYPFKSPARGRARSAESLALGCTAEVVQKDAARLQIQVRSPPDGTPGHGVGRT